MGAIENSAQSIEGLKKKGVEEHASSAVEKIAFELTPDASKGDGRIQLSIDRIGGHIEKEQSDDDQGKIGIRIE